MVLDHIKPQLSFRTFLTLQRLLKRKANRPTLLRGPWRQDKEGITKGRLQSDDRPFHNPSAEGFLPTNP